MTQTHVFDVIIVGVHRALHHADHQRDVEWVLDPEHLGVDPQSPLAESRAAVS